MKKRPLPEFTSELGKGETIAVLAYIPVHLALLPLLLGVLVLKGMFSESDANFLYYCIGFGYMLMFCLGFLRRDFDAVCDRPWLCLSEVLSGYIAMVCLNYVVSCLLLIILPELENPNNEEIMAAYTLDQGPVKAMVMFLAPVVEELMFRAGVFGTLRRHNRAAAYIASIVFFSLYHVWGYAMMDARNWVYVLQYIPVAYLLARCYERTSSVWCSIFFHMLVNTIAVNALEMLGNMA